MKVLGAGEELNQSLEKAGRVADFFELAELMCLDALERNESCGGHFREEYQTPDGEALRDDEDYSYVAAWEYQGRRPAARAAQRAAGFRIRASRRNGATSNMKLTLHIWRQRNTDDKGRMVRYEVPDVNPDMSFLEMLDVLNESLIAEGRRAGRLRPRLPRGHLRHVRLHDQRRGPRSASAAPRVCQLHMRHFKDGDELYLEPWRARAFPVVKDLVVDRSAFDRIIAAGGFISRAHRQRAGRQRHPGSQGSRRPRHGRGRLHRLRRLRGHVSQRLGRAVHGRQDRPPGPAAAGPAGARPPRRGHGGAGQRTKCSASCTNIGECEAVCPKDIKLEVIARMNRDFLKAVVTNRGAASRLRGAPSPAASCRSFY